MVHITESRKNELESASVNDEVFVDDKMPLTVKSNTNGDIFATRNGYDYVIWIEDQNCTVELVDTGRVDEQKKVNVETISVLKQ